MANDVEYFFMHFYQPRTLGVAAKEASDSHSELSTIFEKAFLFPCPEVLLLYVNSVHMCESVSQLFTCLPFLCQYSTVLTTVAL